jgi:predicted MPP superfamily phosphohydrolase
MRSGSFIIFLLIALTIYGGLHFYIIRRGWQALAGTGVWRTVVFVLFLALALSFIAGRMLLSRFPGPVTEGIIIVGNIYLAVWVYLVLFVCVIDILRLINRLIPFFPRVIRDNPGQAGRAAFFIVLGLTAVILAAGAANAARPRLRDLEIRIPKRAGDLRKLVIVLASDIHLNPLMRISRLEKIVKTINGLEPDLILLPGDIVNEDTTGPEFQKMADMLLQLRARYGVFGALGNHESYGGLQKSLMWLEKGGVHMLVDGGQLIADTFYLFGRMDPSALGRRQERKPLKELLAGIDRTYPVILLDHQPMKLAEAEENGVDLQVSGHTHAGQIFPLTVINSLIYEDNQGHYRKGATQYYVSSGVGTWGPPVRVGTVPEIVRLKVIFENP